MFEIFTYGGGDFLRQIFNGIAQIFGSGDYYAAVKTAALIGCVGIVVMAAFQKGKLDFQWIMVISFMFLAAVVPKTNLIITDRIVPANSSVVSNVPIGISLPASMLSKLGDWMTRKFETNFSLPDNIKYTGNGLLFAHHLVEESTRFEIASPTIAASFSDFWKSCVYYDILLDRYTWDRVIQSKDLMSFFKSNASKTRAFTYTDSSGKRSIVNCREGVSGVLANDLNNEISQSTNINGARLIPGEVNRDQSVLKFAASMPVAYQFLTGLSLTNNNIISQNMLANSLRRGILNFASEADASAASGEFVLAKAEAERKNTFNVMGLIAKRMLPKLKILIEGFIYAIFPILILMALLPVTGKVLVGYAKVVAWVNLWAPLYAILHFAMAYWGKDVGSSMIIQNSSSGLSMMTHTGLGRELHQNAAIAGYMSMSIPMISWMMIQFSGTVMGGIVGRLISGAEGPVSGAGNEISSGNVNQGNFNVGNERAFQVNNAPSTQSGFMTQTGGDGVRSTYTTSGEYLDAPSSNLPVNVDFGSIATNAARESISTAVSREQNAAAESLKANASLRSEVDSTAEKMSESSSISDSYTSAEKASYSQAHRNTENILSQFAEEKGVSLNSVKEASTEIFAKAEAAAKFGTPGEGLFGSSLSSTIKAGGGAKAGLKGSQLDSETFKELQQVLAGEEYSYALQAEGSVLKNAAANEQQSFSTGRESSLSQAMSEQATASERHSIALKEVDQATRQFEQVESISASINQKGTDGFINYLKDEAGMSNSEVKNMVISSNQGNSDARDRLSDFAQKYVEQNYSTRFDFNQNRDSIESSATHGISGLLDESHRDISSEKEGGLITDGYSDDFNARKDFVEGGVSSPSNLPLEYRGREIDGKSEFTKKRDEIESSVRLEQEKTAVSNVFDKVNSVFNR